jgi:Family of unknown function (DUF6390)
MTDALVGAGEALFARYAYPPNELGHCGPAGADDIFAVGAGARSTAARDRAPHFQGAWAYLRLLADTASVGDPLHPDVVSAYWLGGELADRVDPAALAGLVRAEFAAQPGVRARLPYLADLSPAGPTHAFHVFVVYPWIGLLRTASRAALSTLDSCRIRWGTVESVRPDYAAVLCRPLRWDGTRLTLGRARPQTCRWSRREYAFVRGLSPGDTVALHWDWVCDRLGRAACADLADRTQAQLAAANAWLGGAR